MRSSWPQPTPIMARQIDLFCTPQLMDAGVPQPLAELALRLASATCPLKPACACSFAADTFARPCSSVCSRDAMDRGSGARRRETPRLPVQDGCRTRWTSGTVVDAGRLTHNPEVAGSNPAPATKSAGQSPLPIMEEGFCMRPVNGFVNAALAQVARQSHRRLASGRRMSCSTL